MKKILLTAAAIAISSATLQAQQRLSLYEEFSGENCAPCALYNPAFWTLVSANPSKVLLIKYQSPIPSAGPIYNAYRTVTDARRIYYGINSAPSGRMNGAMQGTSGHINVLTQSSINSEAAIAAPFNITAAHQWIANGDSVSTTVTLSAVSAFAGSSLKLRMALIEHLQYATAPGTNGETEFHNVVREMYPNAAGTSLASSWTAGQAQTFTIKGRVPAYVNKAGDARVVVWVQDDATRAIPQAVSSAYIPLAVDLASSALTVPAPLVCSAGSASVSPVVTLQNTGSGTVSSATIYYRMDGGTWQTYNWTGSLAAQATTAVTLPTLTATPGTHVLADSVARPNGLLDLNGGNNKASTTVSIHSTTGLPLPISTGFETAGAIPANWLLHDANANTQNIRLVGSAATSTGHGSSHYMLFHDNYNYLSGEANYAILPADNLTVGTKTLDFYVAYAQYATENDRLEVVYSINCGTTWRTVWNMAGAALATAPATTAAFVPTQSQWQNYSVDLAGVPAGSLIAFRATSNYGNNLYVDDVTLRSTVLATTNSVAEKSAALAPNPSNTQAILTFSLAKGAAVQVEVVDALGRTVARPTAGNLSAGAQQVAINTADLAAGVYSVVVRTTDGNFTKRLSVVH